MISILLSIYFFLVRLTSKFKFISNSTTFDTFKYRAPVIYTIWFYNILIILLAFRYSKTCILLNPSNKTRFITILSSILGFKNIINHLEAGGRRSFLLLLQAIESQQRVIIPMIKNPNNEKSSKATAILLAQESGKHLIPISVSCNRSFKIRIQGVELICPLPFSLIEIKFSNQQLIEKNISNETIEDLKEQTTNALNF